MELGPHGVIGGVLLGTNDDYPGARALSENHSLDDEEFAANFTWPTRGGHRFPLVIWNRSPALIGGLSPVLFSRTRNCGTPNNHFRLDFMGFILKLISTQLSADPLMGNAISCIRKHLNGLNVPSLH